MNIEECVKVGLHHTSWNKIKVPHLASLCDSYFRSKSLKERLKNFF